MADLWKFSDHQNQIIGKANLNIKDTDALKGLVVLDAPDIVGVAGEDASIMVLASTQTIAEKRANTIIETLNKDSNWLDVENMPFYIDSILGLRKANGHTYFGFGLKVNNAAAGEDQSVAFIDQDGRPIKDEVLCWMAAAFIPPVVDFKVVKEKEAMKKEAEKEASAWSW